MPQNDEIRIDADALTIGDIEMFEGLESESGMPKGMVDLLDRCVVGGVRHRPLKELPTISRKIGEAISEMMQGASGN